MFLVHEASYLKLGMLLGCEVRINCSVCVVLCIMVQVTGLLLCLRVRYLCMGREN